MNYTKHDTAIVDAGATIGAGTRIWHWVHVSSGAKIGERCSLGQNVYVGNRVVIGALSTGQRNDFSNMLAGVAKPKVLRGR